MKKSLIIFGIIAIILAGVFWKTGIFQKISEGVNKSRITLGELSELRSVIIDVTSEQVNNVGVNKSTTYFDGDRSVNYLITFDIDEPIEEFDIENSEIAKEVVKILPIYLEDIKEKDRVTFQVVNSSRFLLFHFSKSKSYGAEYGEWINVSLEE